MSTKLYQVVSTTGESVFNYGSIGFNCRLSADQIKGLCEFYSSYLSDYEVFIKNFFDFYKSNNLEMPDAPEEYYPYRHAVVLNNLEELKAKAEKGDLPPVPEQIDLFWVIRSEINFALLFCDGVLLRHTTLGILQLPPEQQDEIGRFMMDSCKKMDKCIAAFL